MDGGVMINKLTGNYGSVNRLVDSIGKKIKTLSLNDDKLTFEFEDGPIWSVIDDGQSRCETRYLATEDDLTVHSGATFLNMEIATLDDIENGDVHERECWKVITSAGSSSIIAHNEHNGYYGGFSIKVI